MDSKGKSNIFLLFIEAMGIFSLFTLYFKIVRPLFLDALGTWWNIHWGNILSWISYGIFGAIIAYIIRKTKGGWSWKDLGFKVHRSWKKDIWFGIVIYSLLYLIGIPFAITLMPTYSKMLSQIVFLQDPSIPIAFVNLTIFIFIIGFSTGAFHEEIRYRGYLQGLFTKDSIPAIGFFVSLIPFSLHHYFSQPDWNLLQVLNTLPGGIIFCLGYYATGSLIVPITTHALGNLVPIYMPFLYSRGYTTSSYIGVFIIGILFIIILIIGRHELKYFLKKSKELFTVSGLKMSILGLLLGAIFLCFDRELTLIQSHLTLEKSTYYSLLLVFSLVCLIVSSFRFQKNRVLTDNIQ